MPEASCIPFQSANVEDLKGLIREHEQSADVCKWALYVERGPKREVELRDGLSIQKRFIHAGPKSPYRGFLFLRSGLAIEDEREQALRDEVETEGTHNIAVRFTGISDKHLNSTLITVMRE